jgi:hypothetical protein
MAEAKQAVSLSDVASATGVSAETVREILGEVPGKSHPKELQDRVFGAARRLGYDLKKLKIGKRMDQRGSVYEEVLKAVEEHPEWGREAIVQFLERGLDVVKRVQRKSFPEEFAE